MSAPTVVAALQAALAGEHACVYAYGVAGSRLSGSARESARAGLAAHRARRDALAARLSAAGAVPTPAAAAYDLPVTVTGADSARALAGLVEDRLALVWSDVVGAAVAAPDDALAALAAAAVQEAAVRAARWTGSTSAFPGATSSR